MNTRLQILIEWSLWLENPPRDVPGWVWRERYRSVRQLCREFGIK
jgi:hypothetical protein